MIEGGSGGKRGHSNMTHWEYTEEIKRRSRKARRRVGKTLERQIKEHEPEIKAKIKKERDEENARREAEHNPSRTGGAQPLPKFAVTLPGGVSSLEMKSDEIKFNVGNGKAKAIGEEWRKQFRDAGWKEGVATVNPIAGAVSFSQGSESLSITYTDTGVMPAEVTLSAIGLELGNRVAGSSALARSVETRSLP
jgi:hypothetical protein